MFYHVGTAGGRWGKGHLQVQTRAGGRKQRTHKTRMQVAKTARGLSHGNQRNLLFPPLRQTPAFLS